MKQMKAWIPLLLGSLVAPIAAHSFEAGDWVVRGGVTTTDPRESSDNIVANGSPMAAKVGLDSDTQLGITAEYMLDANWGVELLAATPFEHTATGRGALAGVDIATFKHLPPTLSMVYHFASVNGFQPYAGVGLNYTVLFDEDLTSEFESAVDKGSIDLEDSFGIALQVGADYHVNERWLVNASARWLDLETEAEIRTDGGSKFTADIDVDPMVYTISVGYKF